MSNYSKLVMVEIIGIVLMSLVLVIKANAIPVRPQTTGIVIHHSATATGNVDIFRKYHVETRGWSDVGYHFVITAEGLVQEGRDINAVGAHAKGPRNYSHIGICVVGEGEHSNLQLLALKDLIEDLQSEYPNISQIESHHDQCPNGVVRKYLKGEMK